MIGARFILLAATMLFAAVGAGQGGPTPEPKTAPSGTPTQQPSLPKDVVLDLGKAKFIGSIGFLAFLGVRRELPNGRIVLCNLFQPVRDMFVVSRLIQTASNPGAPFEVAETKEAALERLKA